jgi:two-component system nitrogen regulation response regulator NtrX
VASPEESRLPKVALVVEDDAPISDSLRGLLEDEGFEVMTSSTLARARHILFASSHPVGVLVLDLSLADGDGEALVEELHERGRLSPAVVILSAFADRAVPLAATYAIPHVVKPFDVAVVAATVVVAYERGMRPQRLSTSSSSGMRRALK